MPVNYSVATKTARHNAVVSALGNGSLLVIGTSALSGATGVLVTIPMQNPPFSVTNPAGNTVQMNLLGTPLTAIASASGEAAKAELRTSAGVVIASGLTVGISGTDVLINATTVTSGQNVQATAGTIQHAA